MTAKILPVVAVLGASGLIGESLAMGLARDGFPIVPIARRFTQAQKALFGPAAIECPIVDLDAPALSHIVSERRIEIVVNCIGVLQDTRRTSTEAVHHAFVGRLVSTLSAIATPPLLIHVSIPGGTESDETRFSRTKRAGERAVDTGTVPFVILRPGFVVAQSAYGGSALIRALAALPFDLPPSLADRPLATTDMADVVRTVAVVAERWNGGERNWESVWEVMARQPTTVGDVIGAFRDHLGGPIRRWTLPSWLLDMGAAAGDCVTLLGWRPPICSTALREMQRGVMGDPQPWHAATGIEPASLPDTLRRVAVTVQEKWFARLYLAKPLIIGSLALFWVLSGLIALTVALGAAMMVLRSRGIPTPFASIVTVTSCLADIAVGSAIAFRPACRAGLVAGIGLTLLYLAGGTVMAPALWIDPLGPLIKTIPALAVMLVALAVVDNR